MSGNCGDGCQDPRTWADFLCASNGLTSMVDASTGELLPNTSSSHHHRQHLHPGILRPAVNKCASSTADRRHRLNPRVRELLA